MSHATFFYGGPLASGGFAGLSGFSGDPVFSAAASEIYWQQNPDVAAHSIYGRSNPNGAWDHFRTFHDRPWPDVNSGSGGGMATPDYHARADQLLRAYGGPAHGYSFEPNVWDQAVNTWAGILQTTGEAATIDAIVKETAQFLATQQTPAHPDTNPPETPGGSPVYVAPPITHLPPVAQPVYTVAPTPVAAAAAAGSTIALPIIGPIDKKLALIGVGVLAYLFLAK